MLFGKKPDERVRLPEVMRLRGAHLGANPTPAQAAALEQAMRRCVTCNAKRLCDEVLETRDAKALGLFCPNIHYIQQVRSSLSF